MPRVLFFFDFDNTLFPSALYKASKKKSNTALPFKTSDEILVMHELEKTTISLFKVCLKFGPVKIITNGTAEWVAMTLIEYMPDFLEFMKRNGVPVISARDEVGRFLSVPYSNEMHWKTIVFEKELADAFANLSQASLISIGDGKQELAAMRSLMEKNPQANLTHIRFAAKPDFATLLWQIQSITEIVTDIARVEQKRE